MHGKFSSRPESNEREEHNQWGGRHRLLRISWTKTKPNIPVNKRTQKLDRRRNNEEEIRKLMSRTQEETVFGKRPEVLTRGSSETVCPCLWVCGDTTNPFWSVQMRCHRSRKSPFSQDLPVQPSPQVQLPSTWSQMPPFWQVHVRWQLGPYCPWGHTTEN